MLNPDQIKITEILHDASLGCDVYVEALPRRIAGGCVVDVRKVAPPCIHYSAALVNLERRASACECTCNIPNQIQCDVHGPHE